MGQHFKDCTKNIYIREVWKKLSSHFCANAEQTQGIENVF